ncbi:FAD-binding oxidoreductase [Agrococcus sp. ARC_14]|uniref:FAD-binding oxidoreductase n=1 Tax=Agrococcus sp. ARC_14 TaxID=2919927 RepID=UPI001F051C18|nr:FAD-binding oxidoreductase [Agrococcus sp. ARC_14]MCH1881407.1 FAD-binding oxidoreductase [Agrococcus sp. ARC_14]
MISKEAVKRGYNRGNYTVGAPSQPGWAPANAAPAERASLAIGTTDVSEAVLAELRDASDTVITEQAEVIAGTRDWWARTMVAETSGAPAITDAVIVKVSTEEQVQAVCRIASANAIPLTVSAGRSNVTGAALPLKGGIVLDVCGLDRFVSFDEQSQIIDVEAGMFGDLFEEMVQRDFGMTSGHWPSSYAISTVGGWVACRGAGQLSTRYGKIEDMVVGIDVVLADGERVSFGGTARAAVGPDLMQLFIGSEGTLGVITRVRLKLERLPDYGRAIAYGFDSFADGLEACRRIMQEGATPAALRLYDALESGLQFDEPERHVLLVADEGAPGLVDAGLEIAERVCREVGGTPLDSDVIFERWLDTRYLTGKSAEGFKKSPGLVADTLEMIGVWKDLPAIYDEVVEALQGVPGTLAGSAHQSHAYVDSACLYFSLRGDVAVEERADWYEAAWNAANEVIIRHGATLSHHHGVGLLRSRFMERSLGGAFGVLETVKRVLDPKNILNPGKLGLRG